MKKRTKKIVLGVVGAVSGICVLAIGGYVGLHLYQPAVTAYAGQKERNPYILEGRAQKTYVTAHRSGAELFPENTLRAFRECVESEDFVTDAFEFDLHMTKDGKLILLHDDTLDRTSNAVEHFGEENIKPIDKTYAELRELNMGEHYEAPDKSTPYKGLRGDAIPDDLRVVLLEDVLDYLEGVKPYMFVIDIKDGGETGFRGVDLFCKILQERNMFDRVIFGTFNGEVSEYVDQNYPQLQRSAGIKEVLKFYFSCLINKDLDDKDLPYMALQVPANQYKVVRLGTKKVVDYAHRHNLAVQYWTINDPDEIRRLAEIGADAIMTDVPDAAYRIIHKGETE